MTPTTELAPLTENLLRAVAKERGVSFEEVVALYPDPSEETIEELEDEVDVARAERILATLDRSECKTLDDLRQALGR
jgi:hypothetical protein